jgi:retron-type reverse transcriptase
VVDLELEKFFDRVNHDILMSRLAQRVADQRRLLHSMPGVVSETERRE